MKNEKFEKFRLIAKRDEKRVNLNQNRVFCVDVKIGNVFALRGIKKKKTFERIDPTSQMNSRLVTQSIANCRSFSCVCFCQVLSFCSRTPTPYTLALFVYRDRWIARWLKCMVFLLCVRQIFTILSHIRFFRRRSY